MSFGLEETTQHLGAESSSSNEDSPQHSELKQGQLQEWTEHSTLIFENLKPVEISKNIFSVIWTSLKVV